LLVIVFWCQVGAAGITATWAGGERGRVVIDRMLNSLLSSKGWFYMVTLTANNPSEICQIMKKKGFASRIVIQVIHKFQRKFCIGCLVVQGIPWLQGSSDSGKGIALLCQVSF
jgi:hypothetical protein